jgi:hypothetical protein
MKMTNVELIEKIKILVRDAGETGALGNDPSDSHSVTKKWRELSERTRKEMDEIIDSLCEHRWRGFAKNIYDCEICKTRRFSTEDLCTTTQESEAAKHPKMFVIK